MYSQTFFCKFFNVRTSDFKCWLITDMSLSFLRLLLFCLFCCHKCFFGELRNAKNARTAIVKETKNQKKNYCNAKDGIIFASQEMPFLMINRNAKNAINARNSHISFAINLRQFLTFLAYLTIITIFCIYRFLQEKILLFEKCNKICESRNAIQRDNHSARKI